MVSCLNCGEPLREDSVYCPYCGCRKESRKERELPVPGALGLIYAFSNVALLTYSVAFSQDYVPLLILWMLGSFLMIPFLIRAFGFRHSGWDFGLGEFVVVLFSPGAVFGLLLLFSIQI